MAMLDGKSPTKICLPAGCSSHWLGRSTPPLGSWPGTSMTRLSRGAGALVDEQLKESEHAVKAMNRKNLWRIACMAAVYASPRMRRKEGTRALPRLRRGFNLRDICPLRRGRSQAKDVADSPLASASLSRATDDSPWAVELPRCRYQRIGPKQRLHFRTPVGVDEGLSRCAIPAALSLLFFQCPRDSVIL